MSLQPPSLESLPLFAQDPAQEVRAKKEILHRHEEESGHLLNRLREALRLLYLRRVSTVGIDQAYVSADDARDIMRRYPRTYGLPAGKTMNALGQLFRAQGWERLAGEKHVSTTPGSHGNEICKWRWVRK